MVPLTVPARREKDHTDVRNGGKAMNGQNPLEKP